MIRLSNPQKIQFVQEFIDEFRTNQILELHSIDLDIVFINEADKRFPWITPSENPFSTNPIFRGLVAINEKLCDHLKLNPRERFSMLLHEIGHILDSTPREGNEFQRELNADQFAVDFGLSEELASGLTKLLESDKFKDMEKDMKERIDRLIK